MRHHIIDTGPLVAFLSVRDRHHSWARSTLSSIKPPLLTCEAVLAEAWHLLSATDAGQEALLELLSIGIVELQFTLKDELTVIRRLTRRYRDRPMSLADACLVRLSELYDDAAIITVDGDFSVYRRHGRQSIPLIAPFG